MAAPSTGSVVLVPFPFSDLTNSKLRPVVVIAFARPGKLFTANENLIAVHIGELKKGKFEKIVMAVIGLLRSGIGK